MNRITTILLLLLTGAIASVSSRAADYKYRIWLTDKDVSEYSIEQPEEFLSQECIEKRNRRGIDIDLRDLPVCRQYINQIEALGCQVVVTSRWMNTVVVALDDTTLMSQIAALPFVEKAECVWKKIGRRSLSDKLECGQNRSTAQVAIPDSNTTIYGDAWLQNKMLQVNKLHDIGFKGQNMTIAVLDAGFYGVEGSRFFDHDKVTLFHDFPHNTMTHANETHGTEVLSCMAANIPGTYIGTAPEANYILIVTEDVDCEYPVEEDYWMSGVEMADSIGVDIINTSLAYNIFDDRSMNYSHNDLDGKTAFSSRGANIAYEKGLLVAVAAGNDYANEWRKIAVPSDAPGALTVGSVTVTGAHSSFSSCGYTADYRIKPDVMAMGTNSYVVTAGDELRCTSGTSFSTPILSGALACLWQANPEWSVEKLIEVVRKHSSEYRSPNELHGYGIPDVYAAYCYSTGIEQEGNTHRNIYYHNGTLHLPHSMEAAILTIYDSTGRIVMQQNINEGCTSIDIQHIESGIYVAVWQNAHEYRAVKIAKQA